MKPDPVASACLALVTLAACTQAAPLVSAPGASTPPGNLSGKWQTGAGAEPSAGPLRIELACGYPYGYNYPEEYSSDTWVLDQVGAQLTLTTLSKPSSGATGPAPACPDIGTAASGSYQDGVLTLQGIYHVGGPSCRPDWQGSPGPRFTPTSEPVVFKLSYDATSQHLRGTRNGTPFWAVPITLLGPPASCGPVVIMY